MHSTRAYVLLVQDIKGAVQRTEDSIEARKLFLEELEAQYIARTHDIDLRELAVRRQEAALAALMPRLQAVARMELAMAALIPHLKVIAPERSTVNAPMLGLQVSQSVLTSFEFMACREIAHDSITI